MVDLPTPSPKVTTELTERGLAVAEIFPAVYEELRGLARGYFIDRVHTLQPTSLVHEAYLKLCDPAKTVGRVENRAHFCALAATAMRQILVDRARRRLAQKRGGDLQRVTLTGIGSTVTRMFDALDFDRALSDLALRDPRQARIVELRYFGGLTNEEIAEHLGVSLSTVEKAWRGARAWLSVRLSE